MLRRIGLALEVSAAVAGLAAVAPTAVRAPVVGLGYDSLTASVWVQRDRYVDGRGGCWRLRIDHR